MKISKYLVLPLAVMSINTFAQPSPAHAISFNKLTQSSPAHPISVVEVPFFNEIIPHSGKMSRELIVTYDMTGNQRVVCVFENIRNGLLAYNVNDKEYTIDPFISTDSVGGKQIYFTSKGSDEKINEKLEQLHVDSDSSFFIREKEENPTFPQSKISCFYQPESTI